MKHNRGLGSKAVALLVVLLMAGSFLTLVPIQVRATSVPSGIVTYVPITLTNSQSSPTPAPFQQMVQVDSATYSTYEASNLQNVEFFDSTGAIISSWLESGNSNTASSTIYWLEIAGGIPAGQSVTVYMGFASTSTNLFNTVMTGEAPQLSSTYGQYDDGASVFSSYTNFAGTSLPGGWSQALQGSGSVTVNNGLYLNTGGSTYSDAAVLSNIGTPSSGVIEGYVGSQSNGGNSMIMAMVASTNANVWAIGYQADSIGWQNGVNGNGIVVENNNGGTPSVVAGSSYSPSPPLVLGIYGSTLFVNYAVGATVSGNILRSGYLAVDVNSGTTVPSIEYDWMRVRAYPPNGMMPGVSFGSLTGGNTSPSVFFLSPFYYGLCASANGGVYTYGATIVSSTWDWGDGFTATTTSSNGGFPATHTYSTVGSYTLTVTTLVSTGLTGTASETLTITGSTNLSPPSLSLLPPQVSGLTVTVNGVTNTNQCGPGTSSISWNWGDGSTTLGSMYEVHTYSSAGTYNVCVTSTDTFGLSTTSCESVTVTSSTTLTTSLASSTISVGSSTTDTATLNGGASPSGNVLFNVYSGSTSTACTVANLEYQFGGTDFPSTAPYTSTATITGLPAGSYEVQASYVGDTNNAAATSPCGSEPLTVTAVIGIKNVVSFTGLGVSLGAGCALYGVYEFVPSDACFGIQQNLFINVPISTGGSEIYWAQNLILVYHFPALGWFAQSKMEIWDCGTSGSWQSCGSGPIFGDHLLPSECIPYVSCTAFTTSVTFTMIATLSNGDLDLSNSIGSSSLAQSYPTWSIPTDGGKLPSLAYIYGFSTYPDEINDNGNPTPPQLVLVGLGLSWNAQFSSPTAGGVQSFYETSSSQGWLNPTQQTLLGCGSYQASGTTCSPSSSGLSTGETSSDLGWVTSGTSATFLYEPGIDVEGVTYYSSSSSTKLDCPSSITQGQGVTCTATVTATVNGQSESVTDGGIEWCQTYGNGVVGFANSVQSSCTVAPASRSITVSGEEDGLVTIQATYTYGTSGYGSSSGSVTLDVESPTSTTSTTTTSNGEASVDQTSTTGISVSITSTTVPDGTSVTVTTTDLGNSQPSGTGTVPLDPTFYDVQVVGIFDGTATVCISNAQVVANTDMLYYSNSIWNSASSVVATTGSQVCGEIPLLALTGTYVAIGTPLRQVKPSITTTLTVSCVPNPFAVGSNSSCTAKVSGGSTPNGMVVFIQYSGAGSVISACSVGTHIPCPGYQRQAMCTLSSGSCSLNVTGFIAGNVTIWALYGGDSTHYSSSDIFTITVVQAGSAAVTSATADSVAVNCNNPTTLVGSSITCTATIMGGSTPTGTVAWSSAGLGSITLSPSSCTLLSGQCQVTATGTTLGQVTLKATYGGDKSNQGSSGSLTTTVNSVIVACTSQFPAVGSFITCKATIAGSSPTGKVSWSSSGLRKFSSYTCKLSKGVCSVKYTSSSGVPVVLTASYSGDKNNPASSGTFLLTATPKTSATTLSCTQSSVKAGSSKTVKCTVHVRGYSPTGTVAWSQSGTGSVSLSSATCTLTKRTCSVTVTGKTAGSVAVTASYSGDSDNQGSSGTVKLTIKT